MIRGDTHDREGLGSGAGPQEKRLFAAKKRLNGLRTRARRERSGNSITFGRARTTGRRRYNRRRGDPTTAQPAMAPASAGGRRSRKERSGTMAENAPGETRLVVDVDDITFERAVIERSRTVPVVVDFWAPWCGPCRMLGPILERLVQADGGAWALAKVNTDENPDLAMRFGVQGIPAVKGFRDGRLVAEFVGAQPEPEVRAFLKKVVPGAAAARLRDALVRETKGDPAGAERIYTDILRTEPDHGGALLGLGRLRFAQDRLDEAVGLLQRVPHGTPERAEADAWLARARFRQDANISGGEIALRRQVAAHPDDLAARLALASALADKGDHRAALEGMLTVLERDSGDLRQQARRAMLAVFQVLGDDHPLVGEYRQRMAAALF
jgi:putative thioredoxin